MKIAVLVMALLIFASAAGAAAPLQENAPEYVYEEVKCVFIGTETPQKCYTERYSCTSTRKCGVNSFSVGSTCGADDSGVTTFSGARWECYDGVTGEKTADSTERCLTADAWRNRAEDYCINHCSGSNTCSVEVSGAKGEELTWKSSCGGYAYTTIDGDSEYAEFSCKEETCEEGAERKYTCPDGSQVPWCTCREGAWLCILSPESQCRTQELVDVEITPKIQRAEVGEWAEYKIVIEDQHPLVRCDDTADARCEKYYTYIISAYPVYVVPVKEVVSDELPAGSAAKEEYSASNIKVTGQPVAVELGEEVVPSPVAISEVATDDAVIAPTIVTPTASLELEYLEKVRVYQGSAVDVVLKARSSVARSHPFEVVVYLVDGDAKDRDTATLMVVKEEPDYNLRIKTDKYTYDLNEAVEISALAYAGSSNVERLDIDAYVTDPAGKRTFVDLEKESCACSAPACQFCREGEYCLPCEGESSCTCTFTGRYKETGLYGTYRAEAVLSEPGKECPVNCVCTENSISCASGGGSGVTGAVVSSEPAVASSGGGSIQQAKVVEVEAEKVVVGEAYVKARLPVTYFRVVDLSEAGEYVIQEDIEDYSYLRTDVAELREISETKGALAAYRAYYTSPETGGTVGAGVIVFDDDVHALEAIERHIRERRTETLFGNVIYSLLKENIVVWTHENLVVYVRGSEEVQKPEPLPSEAQAPTEEKSLAIESMLSETVSAWEEKEAKDSTASVSTTGYSIFEDIAKALGFGGAPETSVLSSINAPESLRNMPLPVIKAYLDMHPSDAAKPTCGDGICEYIESRKTEFYCPDDCGNRTVSECEAKGGYCSPDKVCKAGYESVGTGMCMESESAYGEFCCLPLDPVKTCKEKCRSMGYMTGKCSSECSGDDADTGTAEDCASDASCCCSKESEEPVECRTGCVYNGRCIPFGSRMDAEEGPVYCSIITADFQKQKDINATCQNSYECKTNSCADGICYSPAETINILQRIIDFFRALFGLA